MSKRFPMTPAQRFEQDPEFHYLVETLEKLIHEARFTPSELREACLLAAIRYETHFAQEKAWRPEVRVAIDTLEREFVFKR